MTALTEALDDLTTYLPHAAALIAQPDTDTSSGHGQPSSRPPWNPAAAAAALDAIEGAARLERQLRRDVTGLDSPQRPPAQTGTVIRLIAIHATNLPARDAAQVARQVTGWVQAILMLPAIDEAERPRHMPLVCPYCGSRSLWAYVRDGKLACLRAGACTDSDGVQPRGQLMISRVTGDPVVAWSDGLVT